MLPPELRILFILLLLKVPIALVAIGGALWLNLRWTARHDVDWRMKCSWAAFLIFVVAALAQALPFRLSRFYSDAIGFLEFWLFTVSFLLCISGRGAGRILIGIAAAIFAWFFLGFALHP